MKTSHIITAEDFDGYIGKIILASTNKKRLILFVMPLLNEVYYELFNKNTGDYKLFTIDQFEKAMEAYNQI